MSKAVTALLLTALLTAPVSAQQLEPIPPVSDEASNGDAVTNSRFFVSAEYILWWLREGRQPATITTSSAASQGLIGQADTRVLYGDDRLETRHGDRFNGARVTVGYWFDDAQSAGVEANGFVLERDSTHFKVTSDGSTLLARSYANPFGQSESDIFAGPSPMGTLTGGFVGYSRIELFGEEANLVVPLFVGNWYRVEGLLGARFLQMRDRTDLTDTAHILPQQTTLIGLEDHYRTYNEYYGGQFGVRGEVDYGRWFINARAEIGIGGNVEEVRTYGVSLYQTPTERLVTPTGLTVQASNTGTFDRTDLSMVGEVGVNVGYRISDRWRVYVGYTFLLWENALRSGDQIDLVVNKNAGPPYEPSIPFKHDLFWAQGLNVGATFSW